MKRYVPKTYNNRRFLRIIVRTVVTVSVAVLVLFIVLFFWMYPYYMTMDDGTQRLVLPWLVDEPATPVD